jgi:hypothetical protein
MLTMLSDAGLENYMWIHMLDPISMQTKRNAEVSTTAHAIAEIM